MRTMHGSSSRAGRGAPGGLERVGRLLTSQRALLRARLSMTPEEHRAFWRNVQFTVDKDVVRTDRSNQFFRGEGNPNVESMRYCLPGQQGSFPTGFHSHLPPRSLTSPLRSQLTLWEVDQPQKLLQGSRIFLLSSVPQNQRVLSYFRQCQWAPYCPSDPGKAWKPLPKVPAKAPPSGHPPSQLLGPHQL